jgi:hypothetical protein
MTFACCAGVPEPYEKLKALTRGQGITRDALRCARRSLAPRTRLGLLAC